MSDLHGIVVSEFGKPIVITCVNAAGAGVNISTYTVNVKFTKWQGTETHTLAATFLTTGIDGKITCSFAVGNTPLLPGTWRAQVLLTKVGVSAKSKPIVVEVWDAI